MSRCLFLNETGQAVSLERLNDLCQDHLRELAAVSLLLDCIIKGFDQAEIEMSDQDLAESAQKMVLKIREDLLEIINPDPHGTEEVYARYRSLENYLAELEEREDCGGIERRVA